MGVEIVEIPLKDLKGGWKGSIEMGMAVLRHYGQTKPLVVDASTKEVKYGNKALAAMRGLGWKTAKCVLVDSELLEKYKDAIWVDKDSQIK